MKSFDTRGPTVATMPVFRLTTYCGDVIHESDGGNTSTRSEKTTEKGDDDILKSAENSLKVTSVVLSARDHFYSKDSNIDVLQKLELLKAFSNRAWTCGGDVHAPTVLYLSPWAQLPDRILSKSRDFHINDEPRLRKFLGNRFWSAATIPWRVARSINLRVTMKGTDVYDAFLFTHNVKVNVLLSSACPDLEVEVMMPKKSSVQKTVGGSKHILKSEG